MGRSEPGMCFYLVVMIPKGGSMLEERCLLYDSVWQACPSSCDLGAAIPYGKIKIGCLHGKTTPK